jgi:Skp family chaperone for outer membrane proteins
VKVQRIWLLFLVLALATTAAAQGSKTIAVVNGENITEDQLNKAAASDLDNLELKKLQAEANHNRERSEILERKLEELMEEKLLAAEAAKRKIPAEQLLATEVDSKVIVPTDQQMQDFYNDNKARIPVPYEQAASQIRDYMIQLRKQDVRENFFASLKKDYAVRSFFQPVRFDIATAGHPSRGPANAAVTIVEFSDFECPFCGNLFPVMKEIEAKYPDTVRVVYRQFPLNTIHPHAQKAAEASLCAKEQNKFWEYHDSLFENQRDLTEEALKARAANLKLDTAAFDTCLTSGMQAAAVRKDIADGNRAGVTGTPAIYINGRPHREDTSFEGISKAVDEELQLKSAAK